MLLLSKYDAYLLIIFIRQTYSRQRLLLLVSRRMVCGAYIVYWLLEEDKIWQLDRERGPCYRPISLLRLVNFGPEVPLGSQNSEWCKKNFNAFLVHRLADRDEISHDDAHWWVAGLKAFWWTLVHFQVHSFLTADIADTFCHRVTKFGVAKGLTNWHLIPESRVSWTQGSLDTMRRHALVSHWYTCFTFTYSCCY